MLNQHWSLDMAQFGAEDGCEEKALLISVTGGRHLSTGNGILGVARVYVKRNWTLRHFKNTFRIYLSFHNANGHLGRVVTS
jgi:hypothetical protein